MGLYTKEGDIRYYPVKNKHVCANCFDDKYIKSFINGNLISKKCDFCGKESSALVAADFNDVIEYIRDCISTEWESPDDAGVPVDGGNYVWPVLDASDLICDEIGLEAKQEVIESILQAFSDELWYKRKFRTADPMLAGWDLFTEEVKYHRRYFFGTHEKDEGTSFDILPSEFLDRLGKEISELELFQILHIGDIIYRARTHRSDIVLSSASQLGPPTKEQAIYPNRMSPAGIPMFYGSMDIETAIKESVNAKRKNENQPATTVGIFKPLIELNLLDLTALPEVPSIFDDNRNYLRSTIIFLRAFVNDLSKPVEKDEKAHIEYVPTQVFTEYIRHVYKSDDNIILGGILYPSAVNRDSISCVLFIENDECCDKGTPQQKWKPYKLMLDSFKKIS